MAEHYEVREMPMAAEPEQFRESIRAEVCENSGGLEESPSSIARKTHLKNRQQRAKLKKKLNEVSKRFNKKQNRKVTQKMDFPTDNMDEEEEDNQTDPVFDKMCCPVCLEILYSPHSCQPCGHLFCELCLRRMSKYYQDKGAVVHCPCCREPITYCKQEFEFSKEIESFYPKEVHRRKYAIYQSHFMSSPLPKLNKKPPTYKSRDITQIINQRNRQQIKEWTWEYLYNIFSSTRNENSVTAGTRRRKELPLYKDVKRITSLIFISLLMLVFLGMILLVVDESLSRIL